MLKPLLVHHDRSYCRRVPRSQRWRHASYKVAQAIRLAVKWATWAGRSLTQVRSHLATEALQSMRKG